MGAVFISHRSEDTKRIKSLQEALKKELQGVFVVDSTDHYGNDAYRVWMVFANGTSDEDLSFKRTSPLREAARELTFDIRGSDRFPHVEVARKRDVPKTVFQEENLLEKAVG